MARAALDLPTEPVEPAPEPPAPARWHRRALWVLVSIALLALAAGAVRVSTAAFTSTTSSQAGDLVAGTLQLQSPASGLVLLDASNMKRGETRYADVTLTASGNVTAFWSVELKGAPSGSAPLAHALILTIAKDAGSQHTQTLYKGPLDGLTRTTVGNSEPGVALPVRVSLEWPASATDTSLPGKTTTVDLLWRAASS